MTVMIAHINSAKKINDTSVHSSFLEDYLTYIHQHESKQTLSESDLLQIRMLLSIGGSVQPYPSISWGGAESGLYSNLENFLKKRSKSLVQKQTSNYDIIIAEVIDQDLIDCLNPGGIVRVPLDVKVTHPDLEQDFEYFGYGFYRKKISSSDFQGLIHVIIPVHNRCQLTCKCLDLLYKQTIFHSLNIIVVDDGSTDHLDKAIADHYPECTLLTGDGSLWWGGAINKGLDFIRETINSEDFFLFMNNDVFLEPNTLEQILLQALKDRGTCWAPMSISGTEAIASGELGHTLYRFEQAESLFRKEGRTITVETLFGRCTLFSSEILSSVPRIDTDLFPQYWGDSDFSLRIKNQGYALKVTAKIYFSVEHTEETTGSHHVFFDHKQSLSSVWDYLTNIKSLGAIAPAWHFHKRHNPKHKYSYVLKSALKAISNLKLL
ncbi:glycosyltransferase family 2 protein [Temperatibacter marinus]|uniref:Glycosyltransferase family 2 protein n=1 Tax=Temperatibacter marinus TaxID=1456591 RepID=A0AA52EDA5_9PROT|nr:glycosyltransferase family 2 protein [Temperatibacter marinus]WND03347.1 glycosyltransferase family 2 protein [Temperatibacter marinus]